MPGTLVRNVINRVRHNSERSEGSSRKVSFNRDVLVQKIPRRSKKDGHKDRGQSPLITKSDHADSEDAMYNHGVLHPSQQVSDPPRVKRNLVRKIVAQFNEEARLRELLKDKDVQGVDVRDHSPYRSRSPPLIEPNVETAPNQNNPFSYTNTLPPKFLHKKSKSEHNLKSPDEVIYAQVVVNGHGHNGVANKTTVHTKVPMKNGYVTQVHRYPSMNRNQSMSMSSLQGTSEKYQTEIKPTMTQRKFVDGHYQQYYEPTRAASPDISYSISPSPKHQVKEKKSDFKRLNGEVRREDKKASSKESFFHESVHSVNRDAQNVVVVRDKRGDKKDSTLKQEKKLKDKSESRKEHGKQTQDVHVWEKETYADGRTSKSEKKRDDHRREEEISTPRRQLDNAFNAVDSYSDCKEVRGGKLHSEKVSTRHREEKEITGGREEMEHRTWTVKQSLNGHSGETRDRNHVDRYEVDRNGTNFKKAELVKEEKLIRRHHRPSSSSSSPTRDDSPARRTHKDKVKKDEKREKKKHSEEKRSNLNESSSTLPNNSAKSKESERKFYYFGANEASLNLNAKQGGGNKQKEKVKTKENQALSSTKLVKEANAKVSSSVQTETKSRGAIHSSSHLNKSSDGDFVVESPVGFANHDSGYSSRIGMTSTPRSKSVSPPQHNERIVNIEVERHKDQHHHHHNKNVHRSNYVSSAFVEDNEERMETSESDDIPNQWGFGSQESQMSAPSNQWSSLEEEEDEENVVEKHMNTPQSLIREMDKKEISYENSQKSRDKSYNGQLWFERTEIDSDYRRELSSSANTAADHSALRNDNHVNNNWGSSATMSRIESNKNRINDDVSFRSSTIDRRQNQHQHQQQQQQQQQQQKLQSRSHNANSPSTAVRILLNGRDITDDEVKQTENSSFHAHQSSRSGGSYPSETESQNSNKSKGSRKSSGSSPVSKRVNFKTRSKAKRSVSSAANLSPVHREALMRASSPARAGSTTGSLNSSGSDASHSSNRSVILHATTVADIPPARSYRYRIYRDSPSPNGVNRSGKSVSRSFSLLAPWKPKKYKQKYERRYNNNEQSHMYQGDPKSDLKREKETHSHNSSSEKLDSLSPLPSETPSGRDTRRVTVSRHNSMPKDTRFTGFFKKKETSPST